MSNNNAIYAGLIYTDSHTCIEPTKMLKFCGKQLQMFNPILTDTMVIEETCADKLSNWKVTFFCGSTFSQTLSFELLKKVYAECKSEFDSYYPEIQEKTKVGLSAKVAIITNVSTDTLDDDCQRASWFVRNSSTLKQEHLKILPSQWRHIDGRGLVLLEKFDGNMHQAKRIILLQMLALAYYQSFQQINERLSEAVDKSDIKEIEELYESATEFSARYYFFNPVQFSRYPTYRAWHDISLAYELNDKYEETLKQIQQVYSIMNYRYERRLEADKETKANLEKEREKTELRYKERQQRAAEKRNYLLAIFGLIISIISLYDVFFK